jgi:FAD synthase
LQLLIEAAEQTLELNEARRRRTVVRMDAGGGSVEIVNWLLERGYQVHGKDISTKRAHSQMGFYYRSISRPD